MSSGAQVAGVFVFFWGATFFFFKNLCIIYNADTHDDRPWTSPIQILPCLWSMELSIYYANIYIRSCVPCLAYVAKMYIIYLAVSEILEKIVSHRERE